MKRIFVLFAMTLLLTSCAPEIPEEYMDEAARRR